MSKKNKKPKPDKHDVAIDKPQPFVPLFHGFNATDTRITGKGDVGLEGSSKRPIMHWNWSKDSDQTIKTQR